MLNTAPEIKNSNDEGSGTGAVTRFGKLPSGRIVTVAPAPMVRVFAMIESAISCAPVSTSTRAVFAVAGLKFATSKMPLLTVVLPV